MLRAHAEATQLRAALAERDADCKQMGRILAAVRPQRQSNVPANRLRAFLVGFLCPPSPLQSSPAPR